MWPLFSFAVWFQWFSIKQLYLAELVRFSIGLGLLKLQNVIYPRLPVGCGSLVFFKKSNLMEFYVRYLALLFLFWVIDDIKYFWMVSLRKLILEYPKAPLMTFLMILSAILVTMLIKLHSALSVTRDLICGNNECYLLNLNLTSEKRYTGAENDC